MKPNFALSLSFEGIDLLHRAPDGWRAVGHVSFEDPNLSSAITELREQSQTLAPEGVTSKLILPQNQVKFLTLPLGGTRPAGYRALAENALEGATPYPLQDLAIDWRADGATLHVAAVAKETLAEAEGFAQEHDFNPVSFTAEPTSDFPGEPFFGATETATALLSGPVTPDDDATAVIGPAIFPSTTPEPISAPEIAVMDAPEEAEPVVATPSANADTAQTDYSQLALDIEDELSPAIPLSEEELELIKAAEDTKEVDTKDGGDTLAPSTDLFTQQAAAGDDTTEGDAPLPDAADLLAKPDLTVDYDTGSDGATSDDVAAQDTIDESAPADIAPDQADTAEQTEQPTGGFSFASVRARPLAATNDETPGDAAPKLDGAQRGATFEGVRKLTLRPDRDANTGSATTLPPAAPPTAPATGAEAANATALLKVADSLGPTDEGASDQTEQFKPDTADKSATEQPPSMAVFGTRSETTKVGGKPRYLGLILTAALLVGFVIAYGWASLGERGTEGSFTDLASQQAEAPASAEVATSAIPAPTEDRPLPAVEGATLQAAPDTDEVADLPPELQYEPEAPAEAETVEAIDGVTEDDIADLAEITDTAEPAPELVEISTAERYASSGIWDAAPTRPNTPDAASLEDLYIASIDPDVPAFDAVALPDAGRVRSDITPPTQSLPAAAGTTFSFDQRGLVTATREGALTPDGILIYLGKPPVRPANLPKRAPAADATAAAPGEISAEELERRSKVRPQARPENLIETNERSQLGGRTRSELAGLRPKLRPEGLAEANEQNRLALLNSASAPLVDLSGETRDAINEAVAQSVVSTSLKPKARPQNLDTSVSGSVQVASAVRSQPQLPSSASVARQATVKNQLNLRKVSLIGISGKSGARNALVRMKNGRIKKVSVGDRLDGGRVTAISDSELRYKRSSRTVVLKMPRG